MEKGKVADKNPQVVKLEAGKTSTSFFDYSSKHSLLSYTTFHYSTSFFGIRRNHRLSGTSFIGHSTPTFPLSYSPLLVDNYGR